MFTPEQEERIVDMVRQNNTLRLREIQDVIQDKKCKLCWQTRSLFREAGLVKTFFTRKSSKRVSYP